MKRIYLTVVLFLLVVSSPVRAEPTTAPSPMIEPSAAKISTADFAAAVDLTPLRSIALQNMQTVKTLDSFSRELLERITGRSSYNGQDPVFTLLDIAYRPADYQTLNLIKIKNVPLRTDFRRLGSLAADEQERIVKTGMVSLALLDQNDVRQMLSAVESTDVRKAGAVQQVEQSRRLLEDLCLSIYGGTDLFLPAAVVPPAVGATDTTTWHRLIDVLGSDSDWADTFAKLGGKIPPALPSYTADQVRPALSASLALFTGWRVHDAKEVNDAAEKLSTALAAVNPAAYPSPLMRQIEVVYNRLAKMTLPGAAFYFFAFVCFLMSTRSGVGSLRLWGLRLFIVGFLIHTAGIAIRWWLVGSIPIKNEFESVMFSAWFGAAVGLILELRYGRGFFGAGASFVGWMSLIAIFTVPYVFHISIGENIGQVNGVLMSYWLYIHVTMVTASYSMIGMAFLLSVWWLVKYYLDYGTLSRVSSRRLEGGGHGFEPVFPAARRNRHFGHDGNISEDVVLPSSNHSTAAKSAHCRYCG